MSETANLIRLDADDLGRVDDCVYRARFISAGNVRRRDGSLGRMRIAAEALADLVERQALIGRPIFANHSERPDVRHVAGVILSAELGQVDGRTAIGGTLRLYATDTGRTVRQLVDELLRAAQRGETAPDFGLSASLYVDETAEVGDQLLVRRFGNVESVDFVFMPAADGRVLAQMAAERSAVRAALQQGDFVMEEALNEQTEAPAQVDLQPVPDAGAEWLLQLQQSTAEIMIDRANLPAAFADDLRRRQYGTPQEVERAIAAARAQLAALLQDETVRLGNAPRGRVEVIDREREIANAVDWVFGVAGATPPPPALRNTARLYEVATGDEAWSGRVQFAAANTTDLPGLAANSMNKVIVATYDALRHYRWYEEVVSVQPTDGSLQDMQWLQYGGTGELPVVAEGAAYTELTLSDTQESDSFKKYGGYIGISEEMMRNSQIAQLRAVPRQLAAAAVMTRSAKIAAIFTDNSGVGPTLSQDSTALFHANHSNLTTTALSISEWKTIRINAMKQAQIGNSKRLMFVPRICLVPVDLYDEALVLFGYGSGAGGYPGTSNNDVNPYAVNRANDPRPVVVAVPEWTDSNDWAWLCDPALCPVIQMAYGDNPAHAGHPPPQILSVTDPRAGLVFSNDTIPYKVKDRWAYGVSGYRGIGKANVA